MRLSEYTSKEFLEMVLSEGEHHWYWAFYQELKEVNTHLIREIIAFANTSHDEDCYMIFGVSKDGEVVGLKSFNVTGVMIQSLLKEMPFAGGFVPQISLEKVVFQECELAILTVHNTYHTPIFLAEDVMGLLAGVIYTPSSSSASLNASYQEIEELWKKHFGLTKPALECIIECLADKDDWRVSGTSYYHVYHPEYRLCESEMIFDSSNREYYCYAQSNQATYYSTMDITDENTVLKSYPLVHLAGGHLSVPLPEWGFVDVVRSSKKLAYQYYLKDSPRYQLLEFMFDKEDKAQVHAFNELRKVILVYQSLEEKQAFEEYIAFVGQSIYTMIRENSEFSYLATGNAVRNSDYKHKLRTGLVLNEILREWRSDNELASDELYFNVSGTEATGREREDESFIVYAGSKISPIIKASCSVANEQLRQQYQHIIGDDFVLKEDLLFQSPSAASSFITASVTNGRLGWRRKDGISLKSIQEYNKKAKEIQLDLKLW
ncbi:Putative DNA-binding domain-containing protein [Granulicatella balaenopterae]|uniref:Putative DNA-binding domain-containing protein n=1 Tax=Granulicatella balaenopterae TaxID=137733 RepID=A0A1H9KFV3_9LACT|nr:DUF4357 domain-containing protein [Granulicatella balaenopterae]SEQ97723.1 Putative DNA-binding domain-containing protein [Granulicatella balaenopterae]